MALNLYRRHRSACRARHEHNSHSGEVEERQKTWKRCECPILASGTLGGDFKRKSTDATDWDSAKLIVRNWEATGSWNEVPTFVPTPPPIPAATLTPGLSSPLELATFPGGVKIRYATAKFLSDQKGDYAKSTHRGYRYLLNSFTTFSEQLGYVWLHQLRTEDIRTLRANWKIDVKTSRKNLANLKSFFEYCLENKWIPFNPARFKVRHTRNQTETSEKIPFTDEKLDLMFRVCAEQYGKGKGAHGVRWTGQDLSDFAAVSLYTGLRISDVCLFRASRLEENGDCFIRATKNGKRVCTWIPSWLQERIRLRKRQFGDLIFGSHKTEDIEHITEPWRVRLNNLWKLCGPWTERPLHSRFRHSFVRICLQQNDITVKDVAELLGDTEETVRKHYSSWVKERQERLTGKLKRAFKDKPLPMPPSSKNESSS